MLLISLFFIIVSMFCIEPVEAAGYHVEPQSKYMIITCGICKEGGSAIEHKVELNQYETKWKGIDTDSSIGQIKCKLCRVSNVS